MAEKKKLKLDMVSPERPVLSCEAEFVVLPAVGGEMGVLPGHAPFLVQLNAGGVRATINDDLVIFAVSGGFAEVEPDRVALFVETAEIADAIDTERAKQALERAKAQSAAGKGADAMTLAEAESAMRRAQVRLKVAGLRRPGGQRGRKDV
ncbi:MAG: ATP synthase F1 subunit epsilon [Elusimicrobia bacterium]|nr:ATP synthase F1 subunit epsilon [Elusimicrobiota bacterium]